MEPARHFVGRKNEIALIASQLHDLTQSIPVQHCLVNFYGVPGIGKSALLERLGHLSNEVNPLVLIAFSVEPIGKDLLPAKVRFLKSFEHYAETVAMPLFAQLRRLGDDSDEGDLNAALKALVEHFEQLDRPLLMLLDSWEYAPEAVFAWVERTFLLPLVRSEHLLCVLASQAPLRWRQFDVRRRVKAWELPALDPEDTLAQVGCDLDVRDLVYAFTQGHPLANEMVYDVLRDELAFARHMRNVIEKQRVQIAQRIVKAIYSRVLGGVSAELAQIFGVIVLFREFDTHTLRTVLPMFEETFANRSDSALLLSLKQLLDTRLVTWSDERRAYQIDPTIRRIFSYALRWSEPDRYMAIRDAAIRYYQQLIHEVPGNRNVYVVEYYYQALYKDDRELYNQKSLKQNIQTYYFSPDHSYRDDKALEQLRDRFEHDEEVMALLKERGLEPTLFTAVLSELLAMPLVSASLYEE
jgi:hypothetical protein